MSRVEKIIGWAANQSNGHGAHIQAISHVLENDETLTLDEADELKSKRSEWSDEHSHRFF